MSLVQEWCYSQGLTQRRTTLANLEASQIRVALPEGKILQRKETRRILRRLDSPPARLDTYLEIN